MSDLPEVGDRYTKDEGMINEYEVIEVEEGLFGGFHVVLESVEDAPMTGEKARFDLSGKKLDHEYEEV